MEARHFSLTVAYDGAPFHGWQRQPGDAVTVQGQLEAALARLAGRPVAVRASGRTDAGVHALAQWVTCSVPWRDRPSRLQAALNATLPEAVRVLALEESAEPLDALRQTRRKTYVYQFHVGAVVPPDRRHHYSPARGPLDLAAMRAAARALTGRHDFRSFASQADRQRSCVRHLQSIRVVRCRQGVRLFFTADGFLYNMVRALATALLWAGQGRWDAAQVARVLQRRDRSAGPPTAPARGLFLFRVDGCAPVALSLGSRKAGQIKFRIRRGRPGAARSADESRDHHAARSPDVRVGGADSLQGGAHREAPAGLAAGRGDRRPRAREVPL